MEWIETTGKSVAEAKDAALDQLGVDEADAEFEILAESKVGLFGRVKAEARVRARVQPTSPRPKETNPRRKRKGNEGSSGSSRKSSSDTSPEITSNAEGSQRPISKPVVKRPVNTSSRSKSVAVNNNEGAPKMEDEILLPELGEAAKQFLLGLFAEVDTPATISVSIQEDDEIVSLAVSGENLGHLIGPKGSTLQALQELTRTAAQRKTGIRQGRILVDVGQYREKRKEALIRFSHQVAEEVKDAGELRVLEPMNSADRKVVHDTVNGIEGVETTSQGEEPRRSVVIKPS